MSVVKWIAAVMYAVAGLLAGIAERVKVIVCG